jgi:putative IMPACT (imprinted ancient) family translation regulator
VSIAQMTTLRKTPLTEYTLQCEYGQLTGIETLLGQFSGKIVASEYEASVRFGWPQSEQAAFSTKLADFSRGALQLHKIEE